MSVTIIALIIVSHAVINEAIGATQGPSNQNVVRYICTLINKTYKQLKNDSFKCFFAENLLSMLAILD